MNLMPSILHAAWLPLQEPTFGGELFLWSRMLDYTDQPQSNQFQPKTEQSHALNGTEDRQRIPSHPQQTPLSQLRQQLAEQFPSLSIDQMRPASTTAWFPTSNGIPESRRSVFQQVSAQNGHGSDTIEPNTEQPDTEQLAPNGQSESWADDVAQNGSDHSASPVSQTTLEAWQITGVAISAIDALHFLTNLSNTALLNANKTETAKSESANNNGIKDDGENPLILNRLRVGNDLLFFSSVSKFALEILVGQHYLPSVRSNAGNGFVAIWQPALLDTKMQDRFDKLAREMPPVCRAYNLNSPSEARPSVDLAEKMVATLVDSAIRAWSSPDPSVQTEEAAKIAQAAPDRLVEHSDEPAESPAENLVESSIEHSAALPHEKPENYWYQQLLSPESRLSLPPQPIHRLYREWQAWMDQLHVASDAGFRICFVLTEPALAGDSADDQQEQPQNESDSKTWQLGYFLQSRSNPQVLISAAEIWTAPSASLTIEDMRIDQPQERFLAGLGAVSHLFAPIEQSLTNPRPESATLTVHEAYQFMREVGPLLSSSGFGIIMPSWWAEREQRQLGLRLRLASEDELMGEDLPGIHTEIDYSWELTLGNELIDHEAFQRLVDLDSPLVRIHDRWTELNPDQLNAARGFLQGHGIPSSGISGGSPNGSAKHNAATNNTSIVATNSNFGKMTLLQALRMISQKGAGLPTDKNGVDPHDPHAVQPDSVESNGTNGTDPNSNTQQPEQEHPHLLQSLNMDMETPALLPITGVHLDGWLDKAIGRLQNNESMPEISEPAGFSGTLRPYQRRGVAWLGYLRRLGIGACLADDMGLGKTIQAIALHLHIKEGQNKQNGRAKSKTKKLVVYPTLLICPTSVLANWQREINRFAPALKTRVHHGNNRLTGKHFLKDAEKQDFVITSYGTARRDIDFLKEPLWQDVILDEAQNIKNPNAKQTQAVRLLRSQHRIALTGTPIENRLSELWSIFEFLNPNYLGGHDRFHKQFILPIERYNSERHVNRLRQMVQPFLLRRLKTDPTIISDLPEKNEMIVYCSLTPEQQQLYTSVVETTLKNLDNSEGIKRRGLILGLITKLKQIANHPAHYLKQNAQGKNVDTASLRELRHRSGKLSRLAEMLEETISVGDQALIFTQFVEMGSLLQSYLSMILEEDIPFLHGGSSVAQRDRMVQHFQSEDGPSVFILSLRAGGSGLNLTRANHVFHYDRWWNPAIENQATDRAFRIGQQRNVQVHKFVAAGTLEEHIHSLIESKKTLAENIVGSGEDWLTEMDNNQLRDLLMLRSDVEPTSETP